MLKFKSYTINLIIIIISLICSLYFGEFLLRVTEVKETKPFNGKCDREYIESLQNLKNHGVQNFNKKFQEPLFIEVCPIPKKTLHDAYRVTWGHVIKYNSQYFRWREFEKNKENKTSILILGDSITFGVGMPLQKSYPYLLESMLNEGEDENFIVYSLALIGGTPENHLINLKQYYDVIDPDIIVLSLYHNDIESSNKNIFLPLTTFENSLVNFQSNLKKIKLVKVASLFDDVVQGFLIRDWIYFRDTAYFDKNSWHWKNLENNLNEIKEISDNNNLLGPILMSMNTGFSHNIINFNNPPELYKKIKSWHKEFEDEGCKQGYYVFDQLDKITERYNNEYLAVNKWDSHPNQKLHYLYASNLKEHILKLIKIGSKNKYC